MLLSVTILPSAVIPGISFAVWPFFAIGFVIAAISDLTLIALGVLGVSFGLIYLELKKNGGSSNGGNGGNTGDPLGDILEDYE